MPIRKLLNSELPTTLDIFYMTQRTYHSFCFCLGDEFCLHAGSCVMPAHHWKTTDVPLCLLACLQHVHTLCCLAAEVQSTSTAHTLYCFAPYPCGTNLHTCTHHIFLAAHSLPIAGILDFTCSFHLVCNKQIQFPCACLFFDVISAEFNILQCCFAVSRSEAGQAKALVVLDSNWQELERIPLDLGPRYFNVTDAQPMLPQDLRAGDK